MFPYVSSQKVCTKCNVFLYSTNLLRLYGQTTTVQAGVTSTNRDNPATNWDVITKSPLVEGEGEDKVLKLQFDVREYDPYEVCG